eukprot:3716123-Prymnesium_polylepis.2
MSTPSLYESLVRCPSSMKPRSVGRKGCPPHQGSKRPHCGSHQPVPQPLSQAPPSAASEAATRCARTSECMWRPLRAARHATCLLRERAQLHIIHFAVNLGSRTTPPAFLANTGMRLPRECASMSL